MKKQKKFKPPRKKQPFFFLIKKILKLFYKKPKIMRTSGEIAEGSIIVANHCSMKGPVVYELYLPAFNAKWGAGEMLGDYKTRFRYLRDVYFMQKKGHGKAFASFLAAFDAFFSIFFYRGMKFLPTWRDARFAKTIVNTIDVLKDGTSVLIFPENSDDGYKEVLTEFYPGFVSLAEQYYKKTQKDVPVYPVYYHDKKGIMVIGEPCYVQDYLKKGFTRAQIAEEFRKKVNELFLKYVASPALSAA